MRSPASVDESTRPAISVVVPAFNEEHRIAPTLVGLAHHLAAAGAPYEIVVVDDGSTDGTVELVRRLAEARPALRVLATSPNRGKGHAVRVGMLAARGRVRAMIDADGSIPPDELGALLAPIRAGQADVVIGSRYAKGARVATPQPGWRRAWSRLVNRIVQRSLVPGVLDTQCGFKAFTDAAAEAVFGRCRIDGWAFDLEALAIAHRLGLVTREIGVAWQDDPRSRVRPLHDLTRVVREWLTIRANLRRGAYGPLPALARA